MRHGHKAARSPARRGGWGAAGFRGARCGGAGGSRDGKWRVIPRRSRARGGAARAAWQLGGVRAGGWAACGSRSMADCFLLGSQPHRTKAENLGRIGGKVFAHLPGAVGGGPKGEALELDRVGAYRILIGVRFPKGKPPARPSALVGGWAVSAPGPVGARVAPQHCPILPRGGRILPNLAGSSRKIIR